MQCSNDSMMLRIPGPRMPHFLVDRGKWFVGRVCLCVCVSIDLIS